MHPFFRASLMPYFLTTVPPSPFPSFPALPTQVQCQSPASLGKTSLATPAEMQLFLSCLPRARGWHSPENWAQVCSVSPYTASHSSRGSGRRKDREKTLSADSAWVTELRIHQQVHVSPQGFMCQRVRGPYLTVRIDLQAAYFTWPPNKGIRLMTMEH